MTQPSQDASFKRFLIRAAILPIGLLLVLAGVLVWQIQHLLATAAWVEQTDRVITDAGRLLRAHIDMETGLRGFVLTRDRAFLEPFDRGVARIPELADAMRQAVVDEAQIRRLAEIDAAREVWLANAREQIVRRDADDDMDPAYVLAAAGRGKRTMDAIRGQFDAFVTAEERLRAERGRAARQAAQRSVWSACLGVLGVGVVLVVASRRALTGLVGRYESALATANTLTTELEQRVARRTGELGQANHALTEANRELEAFGYSISHDLRAPLRHIGGFAVLLQRSAQSKLSADDAENLQTISDTAKLAGRMVDDLLSFSRIGRAELRQDKVDLNELVDRCRRELEPESRGREVTWTVADLPPAVGDPALLKLVMTNLLSNALKYTSKQPHAAIDIAADTDSGGQTTYRVRDNGVGFDMTYAHKLFGVFQRLHRAEEYEGTGIGLANVRRIITRHGGRVWAEAKPDNGATFFFSLPIKA